MFRNAAFPQPIVNVRLPAHGTNFDNLLESKIMRGNARINIVGQFKVVLVERLDNRGGMNTGRGAIGVVTDDGVIARNRNTSGNRDLLAIFLEAREILLVPRLDAHQTQVHEHLVHLGIPDTLTDAECGGMHASSSSNQGGESIGNAHATIAVAVPIDT